MKKNKRPKLDSMTNGVSHIPRIKKGLYKVGKSNKLNTSDTEQSDLTCVTCGANNVCPYAFDAYNTNGDCLAQK